MAIYGKNVGMLAIDQGKNEWNNLKMCRKLTCLCAWICFNGFMSMFPESKFGLNSTRDEHPRGLPAVFKPCETCNMSQENPQRNHNVESP